MQHSALQSTESADDGVTRREKESRGNLINENIQNLEVRSCGQEK